MALGLLLQNPKNVQVLQTAFNQLGIAHNLLKDEA